MGSMAGHAKRNGAVLFQVGADLRDLLWEVEIFAIGFEQAAFAAMLDGYACYVGM